ncbi:hypothetical protein AC1031_008234 [Aphanomyces cochlioides]|nr:hypothetical protein AC1031_008234 [Aphanomyces cochlioides]
MSRSVLPSASHVFSWYADAAKTIGVIKISRPRVKNCLNFQTYTELNDTLLHFQDDPDVLAVIITGEGDEYFTSGTDVREGAPMLPSRLIVRTLMMTLVHYTKILIGAVNGHAIGIGVTMLTYCDFVFCTPSTTFRTPFMALGIVPELGASVTFQALMGKTVANDLLLRGKTIDANRALSVGFVTEIVPSAGFLDGVVKLAAEVTGQLHARHSLLLFKDQLNRLGPVSRQQILAAIDTEYVEIDRRHRTGELRDLGEEYVAYLKEKKKALQNSKL